MANNRRLAELQAFVTETGLPLAADQIAALEDQGYVVEFLERVPGIADGAELPAFALIPNGANTIRVPGASVNRQLAQVLLGEDELQSATEA